MRTAIILIGFCLVAGGWHVEDGGMELIEDQPFVFRPSVRAELTYQSHRSTIGWGSFDLSAAPEHDDIRVDLFLGAPAPDTRWTCGGLTLDIDGRRYRVPASYAGVPMNQGVYDAITAKLDIEMVRSMVGAEHVRLAICGEDIDVPHAERLRLHEFIDTFDDIGLYVGPSAPSPPPELGPEHEWIFSDPSEPVAWPTPA